MADGTASLPGRAKSVEDSPRGSESGEDLTRLTYKTKLSSWGNLRAISPPTPSDPRTPPPFRLRTPLHYGVDRVSAFRYWLLRSVSCSTVAGIPRHYTHNTHNTHNTMARPGSGWTLNLLLHGSLNEPSRNFLDITVAWRSSYLRSTR